MTRVKRGVTANKRRKNLLKHTKGYRWGRKSKFALAKEATMHAWSSAFHDRRKKKGVQRKEWQVKINAASRENGLSYSKLIFGLKKANITLDRKILSQLAVNEPKIFNKIVGLIK